MTLKYRHVRAEWQQFVEWPYKKVSTLCGVKTAAHNAGIPGLTDETDWCPRCALSVSRTVQGLDGKDYMTNESVRTLYSQAWLAVQKTVGLMEFKTARILEKA